jgi:hypothetical protein
MSNAPEEPVLRFGWVFHAVGLTLVLLAALFPLLMWLNRESFDASVIVTLVALAVFGTTTFLYSRAYEVRILNDGFVLSRLMSRPREVKWSSVVAARLDAGDVIFDTTDGQTIKISGYLPDLRRLVVIADERLPKSAWRD